MPYTLLDETNANAPKVARFTLLDEPADLVKNAVNRSGSTGIADAVLALGSGAVAAPVAGFAGLAQGVKNLFSEGMPAGDRVRQVQDSMTYEPRTEVGQGITKTVSYPFEKIAEYSDKAGGAVTDKAGPVAGTAVNTALQAFPMVMGRGKAGAKPRPSALVEQAEAPLSAAREAGYVAPPTQANPSVWNKIAEGFGGKIKTAQDASLKNQPVTNALVREGLGLPSEAPLNAQTLTNVRKEAGQAYEAVRGAGTVTTDPAYFQALDKIAAPYERAAKDFPDAARADVIDAVKAAKRDSFDASSAVDQIGILRSKADKAFADKDKDLGRAYKSIAGALEEQLSRHIEQSGAEPGAIEAFRNARETIAKTYTVEKHLQPDGNVDARGLGNELKRKPLSGEIKTAAEFGRNFPKAAQLPEKIGGVPLSPLDHGFSIASLVGAVLSGHPGIAAAAALPYARPLVRNAMLSDFYQSRIGRPSGPSVLDRLQDFQAIPGVPLAEVSEGQRNAIRDLVMSR